MVNVVDSSLVLGHPTDIFVFAMGSKACLSSFSLGIGDCWPTNVCLIVVIFQIRVLFLLGTSNENTTYTNKLLSDEEKQHGDLIQGNFIDSYYNLTKKTLMGMQWVSYFCR